MLQKVSLFSNRNAIKRNRSRLHHVNNILNAYKTVPNFEFDLKKSMNIMFYQKLVERYNARNYYSKTEEREDIGLIDEIYKKIEKPTEKDINIINFKDFSLENLALIFDKNKENKKTFDFVDKFYKDISHRFFDTNKGLLSMLLKSENSNEYINNYSKYKPYLQVNRKNEAAVKELDEMVNSGTYDIEKYEKMSEIDSIGFLKKLTANSKLAPNNLLNIYNKDGNNVISSF